MNFKAHTLNRRQQNKLRPAESFTLPTRETPGPAIGSSLRILLTSGVALYLLAAMGCAADTSPMWKKLDGAPYPVQVNSLVTGNRSILSAQRTLTYGDWRVGFAKEPPVATSENNCSWQFHCDVKIDPLICTTSNGQVSNCSLRFDTLAEHCDLLIAESRAAIRIACPVDIILAAQDKPALMRLSADVQTPRPK